jgi:hypothetical protein
MKLVYVEQCYVARDTVDIEGHFRTKCPNNVVFMPSLTLKYRILKKSSFTFNC